MNRNKNKIREDLRPLISEACFTVLYYEGAENGESCLVVEFTPSGKILSITSDTPLEFDLKKYNSLSDARAQVTGLKRSNHQVSFVQLSDGLPDKTLQTARHSFQKGSKYIATIKKQFKFILSCLVATFSPQRHHLHYVIRINQDLFAWHISRFPKILGIRVLVKSKEKILFTEGELMCRINEGHSLLGKLVYRSGPVGQYKKHIMFTKIKR